MIAVFSCLISLLGCSPEEQPATTLSTTTPTPLRVRGEDGNVKTITFARMMAWHHEHEHHDGDSSDAASRATPASSSSRPKEAEHDDGLCIGVATGYQAIRYATGRLFPNQTPKASDFDISVAGAMRGVWDAISLHAGKKLAPPKGQRKKKLSLESFTFTARRISTGESLAFRLRSGLIPPEFFRLKNSGATCDDPALNRIKDRVVRKILSLTPEECFETIVP